MGRDWKEGLNFWVKIWRLEGGSHANILGKGFVCRRNWKCKGPEAGMSMTWSRNRGNPLWLELGEEGPWGGKWDQRPRERPSHLGLGGAGTSVAKRIRERIFQQGGDMRWLQSYRFTGWGGDGLWGTRVQAAELCQQTLQTSYVNSRSHKRWWTVSGGRRKATKRSGGFKT